MLLNILQEPNLIFYILAAEVFLLCLLQLRTNGLLKKTYKLRVLKKEKVQQMKEEAFVDRDILPRYYPEKDFHNMIIGKIEKVLVAE